MLKRLGKAEGIIATGLAFGLMLGVLLVAHRLTPEAFSSSFGTLVVALFGSSALAGYRDRGQEVKK